MGRVLRIIAAALALCAVCSNACAAQAVSRVTFDLCAEKSFEEPMSRWLNEMCEMAVITTGFYWDENGKYLVSKLDMGTNRALELRLIRRGSSVLIDCGLLKNPVMVEGVCDWADDMFLYAAFSLKTPSSGSATPVSAEGLALALKRFAAELRAISAVARGSICRTCENCGSCEKCQTCDASLALSLFAQTLAERFDNANEHNALIINCERLTVEAAPFEIEAPVAADDGLAVELVEKALKSIADAIAANA